IAVLREVADAHSATPAQIALAWVIHRPAVVAIPGAAGVEQLESNVAAAEIKLGDDEYQALQAASDRFSPITGAAALPRFARARPGRGARRAYRRTCPAHLARSAACDAAAGPPGPCGSETGEQVGLGDARALAVPDEPLGAEPVPERLVRHGQEEGRLADLAGVRPHGAALVLQIGGDVDGGGDHRLRLAPVLGVVEIRHFG